MRPSICYDEMAPNSRACKCVYIYIYIYTQTNANVQIKIFIISCLQIKRLIRMGAVEG